MHKLGEQIRQMRTKLGWSQRKLAEKTGVFQPHIVQHEHDVIKYVMREDHQTLYLFLKAQLQEYKRKKKRFQHTCKLIQAFSFDKGE